MLDSYKLSILKKLSLYSFIKTKKQLKMSCHIIYFAIINLLFSIHANYYNGNKKSPEIQDFLEATTRFELVIRVLQTRALPLGYVAI